MKGKQLLSKSEVLQDEIRTRPENAENPAKKMPQIRDHEQNLNGNAWNRDPFQVLDPTNPRGFEEAHRFDLASSVIPASEAADLGRRFRYG